MVGYTDIRPSPLLLPTPPGSAGITTASPVLSAPPIRRFSTSSFSKLSDFHLDSPTDDAGSPAPSRQESYSISRRGSSLSLSGEASGVKGVRHVELSLDAGEWRHPVFKQKVLSILRKLRVPLWNAPNITPSYIHLQKVSGALTNAVFFLSFNPSRRPTSPSMSPLLTPTMPPSDPDLPLLPEHYPPTLLLRIYGPSSDVLISRTEELRILHVLSSQYGLGPKVFGTFDNGRVEQFFPSQALSADELRDPLVSRGIARRMRELHQVDLQALGYDKGGEGDPVVWKSLAEWTPIAGEVLNTLGGYGGRWEVWVETFGLHRLAEEIKVYKEWVDEHASKGLVFSHNDTQYGNLLKLDAQLPKGMPDHHRYIVIDFEYAAPNPRGYDIANHFHEWRANYHHPTLSHSLQPHHPYPNPEQRENFYRAYLSIRLNGKEEVLSKRQDVDAVKVEKLEKEVRIWSPACSVFWALWGIIQAEEHVGKMVDDKTWAPDFDYLAYAMERLEMFRKEALELGVPLPQPK